MASTVLAVELGNRIRQLRTDRGWSQRELARRIGAASKSVISYYELGERFPSYELLIQMSNVFGVSTDYLLRGDVPDIRIETGKLTSKQVEALITIIKSMKAEKNNPL